LSGFVFQDGPAIVTTNGLAPESLEGIRDGQKTPDDKPLPGVLIQLRDGFTGAAIDASEALPGQYLPGPIQTRTDANGYYEFRNIPGGRSYAVYEVHPSGYIDGIDTAGSTTGFAFNPQVAPGPLSLEPLADQPAGDAIIRIALTPGEVSENNNFSEVQVTTSILPPPPEPPVVPPLPPIPPPRVVASPISLPGRLDPAPTYIAWSPPRLALYHEVSGAAIGYSWHLSVVNGGMPRDAASAADGTEVAWRSSTYLDETQWQPDQFRDARWIIGAQPDGTAPTASNSLLFGIRGSRPITGDFDGDGKSEVGIYYRGEWFIDLNGNGQWDEQDLWAKLGDELDRPVVGDWDGDGKDDIGIHGPEWFGDQRQIVHEPGLPDSHNDVADNANKHNPKNIPPTIEEATDGHRVLQLRENGIPRADVIDHVFRYGAERDSPVAGDWNGDGIRTIGVFHDGKWRIDSNGDGALEKKDMVMHFGRTGDIPVVGDWDGNGVEEIGVYRAGRWFLDVNGNKEMDAHDKVFEMGGASDRPVVGDWNGDGIDEPGIYRELAPRADVHVSQ
jgi:serine-aspartate repeat-containing protein C/D/E